VLILFAVYAVYKIIEYIRVRRFRDLSLVLFVLALGLVESNHNLLGFDNRKVETVMHYTLGSAYKEMGDTVNAVAEFRMVLASDPAHGASLNSLGSLFAHQDMIDSATYYFEKAIHYWPSFFWPYLNYADVLSRTGSHEEALEVLARALDVAPNSEFVYYELARANLRYGDRDAALSAIEVCLRLNPNNKAARKVHGQIVQNQDAP
jgi:tetratricopeptide (TPR) repeat protein